MGVLICRKNTDRFGLIPKVKPLVASASFVSFVVKA